MDGKVLALITACIAAAGCVDKGAGPQPKKIDPAYIAENLLLEPPATLGNKLDADLGGKLIYLGNDVDHTTVAPGDKVRITHYWKVVAAPGSDWRVFTHVVGDGRKADFMNVDATDMRIGHGPEKWQAGEIVRDIQDIVLRKEWSSPTATVIVGLYRKGHSSERLPVVSGPKKDNAVLALTLPVDLSKAPPPKGVVHVSRASGPITIDGKASEPSWKTAAASAGFVSAEGGPDVPGATTAKVTWDDQGLYVFVSADDNDVWSQYKNHDDSLWKEDVVEVFLDADANQRGYVEILVNPNNAIFDNWWKATRAEGDDRTWTSTARSAVVVRGSVEPRGDDQGWDVEIAIPWEDVKGKDAGMKVTLPPQPGDRWRFNLVRSDLRGEKLHAASWSQVRYSEFHSLDRMATLVFADATGNVDPSKATPAPTTSVGDGDAGAAATVGGDGGVAEPPPGTVAPTAAKRPADVKPAAPAGGSTPAATPAPTPAAKPVPAPAPAPATP